MIWTWLAFALTLGASVCGWKGSINPGLGGYIVLAVPILIAAPPLVWRTTKVTLVCAVLLALYVLNPLIFGGQLIYLPATIVLFAAAWRVSHGGLFTAA